MLCETAALAASAMPAASIYARNALARYVVEKGPMPPPDDQLPAIIEPTPVPASVPAGTYMIGMGGHLTVPPTGSPEVTCAPFLIQG